MIPGSMGKSIDQTTSVMSCLPCSWSMGTLGHLFVTIGATGDPLRATNYTKTHPRFLYFFYLASSEHSWPSHIKVNLYHLTSLCIITVGHPSMN